MTSPIAEYTSHHFPKVTRIQFEGCIRVFGALVVAEEDVETALESIWHLIDEALTQNTRYFSPKPLKLFVLQFDIALEFKGREIVAVSDDELRIRPAMFIPKRLLKAARLLVERRLPFGPATGSSGHD
jgi:hypothetical protein